MPVNGSLCNYDYVQSRAPGTGLNHRTMGYFQSKKKQKQKTHSETKHQSSGINSSYSLLVGEKKTRKLCRIITLLCHTHYAACGHRYNMFHCVYCSEQMRQCYRRQLLTHLILPAVLGGHLRDQHPVCPTGQGAHQGQVADDTHRGRVLCLYAGDNDSFICLGNV